MHFSSCLEEILEKKKELEFDISMRCISILRYLAEYADNLPICVLSRLLATHDVPYLLAQLIENQPWKKENAEGIISYTPVLKCEDNKLR